MALIRWEPAREFNTLQSEMNRLFSSFFDTPDAPQQATMRRWIPAMDLVERDDHFVLMADLPGLTQDDVNIEVEGDTLTISGERSERHETREGGFVRLERASGAFNRSLTLPAGVDAKAVDASFADGVLEVRIPKPDRARPRRVSISVGDRPKTLEGEITQGAGGTMTSEGNGGATTRPLQEDPERAHA
ncbi:MAG: Hsp20/alpha crystallin family protein [Solirubrobacterales bacterium]|nr:Hsp20/alpha crystallin family protein [Solirubrobacterales bacterium]